MNAKKLLSLWSLKWNPFSPELPSDGLWQPPKIEHFAWRVEQRTKERLLLSSEHRAAPAAPSVCLELVATNAQTAHLEVVAAPSSPKPASLAEQVLALLTDGVVLTRAKLRELLGVKNERLGQTLQALEREGQLRHTPAGWQRAD
jgi:hypothetical protein